MSAVMSWRGVPTALDWREICCTESSGSSRNISDQNIDGLVAPAVGAGQWAADDELMRGAREGQIGEESFIKQAALAVGVQVDICFPQQATIAIGDHAAFVLGTGKSAFI